jgi:hypothetical protein
VPIEREIRHQPFELRVFLAELPEFPQFAEAQPRVLAFPQVERLLTDPHRSTDLDYGRPALRVSQGSQDLLFGMPSSSCHRRALLPGQEDHVAGRFLKLSLAYFSGFGSGKCTDPLVGSRLRGLGQRETTITAA